jgi:hypothetical protein
MAVAKKNEETLGLYQKLLKIQQEIIGLGKDSKSFGYQYVSGSKVIEHIKPLMNEFGLLLKQEILSIENTRQDYNVKSGPKSEILSKVMMKFTWIDVNTGERDENLFGANGQNDWEKGLGSALTYAERYFLLKYFHINTDEDDIDSPTRKREEAQAIKKPSLSTEKTPIVDMAKLKELLASNRENTLKQLASSKFLTKEQVNNLFLKESDLIGIEVR